MISKDKQYRTRDGREVRIYATDGDEPYQVHGAMKGWDGSWEMQIWTIFGAISIYDYNKSTNDLIEVKPRIKGWVNVYPPEHGRGERASVVHASRERADKCAGANRIACVPIDAAEGEGL